MKSVRKHIIAWVAPLFGGAILLFSCSSESAVGNYNPETMLTQQSDTLTMLVSQNGVKSYRFYAPLMERYELAAEPYMEFRRGVDIITYDSLGNVESTLKADYGISYEKRELWEARGNVVAEGEGGRTLYTQQLFWDQKTDRVYSNVDCMVREGEDYFVGEGFESDSDFKDWRFRNQTGRIHVDMSQMEGKEEDAIVVDDEDIDRQSVGAIEGE
ncbi:MAG: LPS export ABC transporter periplasmic protein LptC [Tidjanibacter sp.]|nr:LPS export ABC transporter periplasmic protein LptC [Tidjanibacter sp.]